MNPFEARLRVCPLGEFLREPAVVSVRAPIVGKAFSVHQTFHARVHGVEIEAAACEQVFERQAFQRRVGMKRKVHPTHIDVEVLLQSFNTPGTEIAPGSNEVGEDFQYDAVRHN